MAYMPTMYINTISIADHEDQFSLNSHLAFSRPQHKLNYREGMLYIEKVCRPTSHHFSLMWEQGVSKSLCSYQCNPRVPPSRGMQGQHRGFSSIKPSICAPGQGHQFIFRGKKSPRSILIHYKQLLRSAPRQGHQRERIANPHPSP